MPATLPSSLVIQDVQQAFWTATLISILPKYLQVCVCEVFRQCFSHRPTKPSRTIKSHSTNTTKETSSWIVGVLQHFFFVARGKREKVSSRSNLQPKAMVNSRLPGLLLLLLLPSRFLLFLSLSSEATWKTNHSYLHSNVTSTSCVRACVCGEREPQLTVPISCNAIPPINTQHILRVWNTHPMR